MTIDERRSKQRFNVSQFVDISFMKEDFIPVVGLNISENGLLVKSDRPLDPYTKIFFLISLGSDAEPIKGEGLSIHSDEEDGQYLIGVQIIDMKYQDKLKLKAFLENLPA